MDACTDIKKHAVSLARSLLTWRPRAIQGYEKHIPNVPFSESSFVFMVYQLVKGKKILTHRKNKTLLKKILAATKPSVWYICKYIFHKIVVLKILCIFYFKWTVLLVPLVNADIPTHCFTSKHCTTRSISRRILQKQTMGMIVGTSMVTEGNGHDTCIILDVLLYIF